MDQVQENSKYVVDYDKEISLLLFLFLADVEGLHLLLQKATQIGRLSGLKVGTVSISHLQYADDTLLFAHGTTQNLKVMKGVLLLFELISGLSVNFSKSCLYGLQVRADRLQEFSNLLQCKTGSLPFTYLGIHVGGNPRRINMWKKIVQVVQDRVSNWSNKFLSLACRSTLIKSVLSSLPLYYLSVYRDPAHVIKSIAKILSSFFWKNKEGQGKCIHWIRWKDLSKDKRKGGLGFKSLCHMNKALLFKWIWRLRHESDSLWSLIIKSKYFTHRDHLADWSLVTLLDSISNSWKDIWKLGQDKELSSKLKLITRSGDKALFWRSDWMLSGSLTIRYERLYKLSTQQNHFVSDMISSSGLHKSWQLTFRRDLRQFEMALLEDLMNELPPPEMEDSESDY